MGPKPKTNEQAFTRSYVTGVSNSEPPTSAKFTGLGYMFAQYIGLTIYSGEYIIENGPSMLLRSYHMGLAFSFCKICRVRVKLLNG